MPISNGLLLHGVVLKGIGLPAKSTDPQLMKENEVKKTCESRISKISPLLFGEVD